MPRQARIQSKTGIYHVMLRGINQQQIFYEESDYEKLKQIIKESEEPNRFRIFAYCFMGNHIHLLIKEEEETIGQAIKRIGLHFVYWYNIKYQRVGHLFQDRFKSEPVESNEYFLTVLRYIHQNPVKANLCKSIKEYKYSSYREYIEETDIVDTDFVYAIIEKTQFESFNEAENKCNCLDVDTETRVRLTDEQAQKLIVKYSRCDSVVDFQNIEETKKKKCIVKLYAKGMSIRQISRLTGTTKKIVEKYLK